MCVYDGRDMSVNIAFMGLLRVDARLYTILSIYVLSIFLFIVFLIICTSIMTKNIIKILEFRDLFNNIKLFIALKYNLVYGTLNVGTYYKFNIHV